MAAAQSSAGCPAWLGCARADVTPFQAGLAALTIVQGAFDARNSPRLQAFLSQILH
jgi:hypothetical protein